MKIILPLRSVESDLHSPGVDRKNFFVKLVTGLAIVSQLCFVSFAIAQAPPAIALRDLVSGFTNPVEMVAAGDFSNRMFVVEQAGRIKIVDGINTATPTVRPTLFLDVSTVVSQDGGERGLLGLAFPPGYAAKGYFFIAYTRPSDGALEVARVNRRQNDANQADAATRTALITIPHPTYSNHNGGKIAFDPEGFLVISTGDGGGGGDPDRNALKRSNLLGKLLRIAVSDAPGYSIPPTNPYDGSTCAAGTCPEILHFGLRNPWKFSFDRFSGDLYIGDVGQSAVEEINFVPRGGAFGQNFGWGAYEGNNCFNDNYFGPAGACTSQQNHSRPIATYGHNASGGIAVTGGYVYRGYRSAALRGYFIYADYGSRRLFAAKRGANNAWASYTLAQPDARVNFVSAFGQDESGELYVVDYGNGKLFAIDGPGPRATPAAGDLSGEGRSDLLIQNADGSLVAYLMNGDAVGSGIGLLGPGTGWSVTHTGDLNGDGKTDLILQNTNGSVYVYLMDGLNVTGGNLILGAGTGWSVSQVADLDGDGKADLILRNTNGAVFTYIMNGASVTSGGFALGGGTGWSVTHAADLSGDGKADLVLRNTNGSVFVYLMNGSAVTGGAPVLGASTGWSVTHTGDLNGDGRADLLLRNTSGATYYYLMNGASVTGGAFVIGGATDWVLSLVGDLNGNGKADLVMRGGTGEILIRRILDPADGGNADLIEFVGEDRVTHLFDYDGNGKSDFVFRENVTGRTVIRRADGLSFLSVTYLLGPNSGWTVIPKQLP